MIEKTEFDFSNDLHLSLEGNPSDILIEFKNGNRIRISWDLYNSLLSFREDKK